jgi:DNA (cytosine-5)-methyltransferase 3A
MNVLSLFDGMSCGQIALNKLGITNYTYYAAEIKNSAIKVAKFNYPNTIHIGDVTKVKYIDGVLSTELGQYNVGKIDLLLGGSPCQDFSIAGLQKGLLGERSKLFLEYLRIKNEVKPRYWLLENVKMNKNSKKELDTYLNTEGCLLNSKLVSYQSRPRIYWSNLNITIPKDLNINFQDYIGIGDLEEAKVNKTQSRERMWNNGEGRNDKSSCANVTKADKVFCLTRKQDRSPNSGLVSYKDFCRYLTRRELEQAQTVPLGYTDIVSYNQAQDLLGDGWTVDVIAHLLKGIINDNKTA